MRKILQQRHDTHPFHDRSRQEYNSLGPHIAFVRVVVHAVTGYQIISEGGTEGRDGRGEKLSLNEQRFDEVRVTTRTFRNRHAHTHTLK